CRRKGAARRALLLPASRREGRFGSAELARRETRLPGLHKACRGFAGEAAEHGAGHEPRAAGVIVVVEPADDLASGEEAGDRPPGHILHLAAIRDLEAAER